MSDYIFPCPRCGKNIQYDDNYVGSKINCPICQGLIVVPAASRSAARPPAGKSGSGALRTVLISLAVLVACAGLAGSGWYFYSKHKAKTEAGGGNPAAYVPKPSAQAAATGRDILAKMHSAHTNLTSYSADGTVALWIDLSKITMADANPNRPTNAKNADRHPPGMPRGITNTTEFSIKLSRPNSLYCFEADANTKIDRQTRTNTFAFWQSDKGNFMFIDMHQRGMPATYRQLPHQDMMNLTNSAQGQFGMKEMEHFFSDPEEMAKLVKNLGGTGDESVNGQDCYTFTAKVLGQKLKVWVNKTTHMALQWQLTLGGDISDADVDDAFAVFGGSNLSSMQAEMIKAQVKKVTPTMKKIRGTITSTCRNVEMNPALSSGDFDYPVPPGTRLVRMPNAANTTARTTSSEINQRDACINNLRQIDAAKQQWALEKGKKAGDTPVEADLKPYLTPGPNGVFLKCPAGGKYTIGKVGEPPTCSIPGHELP